MINLYVSQPMNGKTTEEIETARNEAADYVSKVLKEPVNLINSFFVDTPHEGRDAVYYLGEAIKLMADASIVYFVDGWQDYRGCRIEHDVTEYYGIETMYHGGDINAD